jgi:pimeloyl-ACP methyl ester carboxylesterase
MALVEINDIKIYYEQYGNGADLVLIAGLGSDCVAWSLVVSKLSQFFRVTIFDNRGAGRSSQPNSQYSVEQMANDCICLMDTLSINNSHFVGYSMGGQVVQEIAISYPQYVNKAIIVASTYYYIEYAQAHFRNVATLISSGVNLDVILWAIFPWIFSSRYLASEQINDTLQAFKDALYPQSYAGYCGQIAAIKDYNSLSKLHLISAPVLLITADEDLLIPAQQTKTMLDIIPNVYHSKLSNCAHMPQVEAPDKLTDLIVNFLR